MPSVITGQDKRVEEAAPGQKAGAPAGDCSKARSSSPESAELNNSCSSGEGEPGVAGTTGPAPRPGSLEPWERIRKVDPSSISDLRLTVVVPGVSQPLSVTLTTRDTVQDVLQFALDRSECCYHTALAVHHDGHKLDNFFELGSIIGVDSGATLELVEEPYKQRDVHMHVARLRDLISPNPLAVSAGTSFSLLPAFMLGDPGAGASKEGDSVLDRSKLTPPPYCLPKATPSLLHFYPHNFEFNMKSVECLKKLSYSAWNPPPSHRILRGDLLYLDVTTLEGQEFHMTAVPAGFYLNKSTGEDHFDPSPRKKHAHLSKTLVQLLQLISPLFKQNFAQVRRLGEKRHALEVLPVPYPVSPWLTAKPEHRPISFRIDDGVSLKASPDGLFLGQMRDWNEELQSVRELPADTSQLKLFRDRTLFKIHCDFVHTCRRGAMAMVDGYLSSINPGDEDKHRMYMWNNIFLSSACDGRDQLQSLGGDEAAHVAALGDLNGIAELERMEGTQGLSTLGTVIVDYRGHRVVCQSVMPGLMQREMESSIVYGSLDSGKSIYCSKEFIENLAPVARQLHNRRHKIRDANGKVVELPMSLEVKGMVGTDGRTYALDLFRLHPPDANFMAPGSKCRHTLATLRPELLETFLNYRYLLFLKLARDKTASLKVVQELQESLLAGPAEKGGSTKQEESEVTQAEDAPPISQGGSKKEGEEEEEGGSKEEEEEEEGGPSSDTRIGMAVERDMASALHSQLAGLALSDSVEPQQLVIVKAEDQQTAVSLSRALAGAGHDARGGKEEDEEEGVGAPEVPGLNELEEEEAFVEKLKSHPEVVEAMKEAAKEAGSTQPDFEIQFNTDALSTQLDHVESDETLELDRKMIVSASTYLVEHVVSRFVRDCVQLQVSPLDGDSLRQALHSRGINLRYLGHIAELAARRSDLHHLQVVAVSEMVVRAGKRKLREILQMTALENTVEAIVHFLNCFLPGGVAEPSAHENGAEVVVIGNGRKKNKKKKTQTSTSTKSPHLKLSAEGLWSEIVEEVAWSFKHKLEYTGVNDVCRKLAVQKVSILREFCKKTGVQLVQREFDFSASPTFSENDVAGLVPVVTHTNFRPAEAVAMYQLAERKLNSGNFQASVELFADALHLFVQVYGPIHEDIGNCYRNIAKILHASNELVQALTYQHKATLVYERAMGADHPETIAAYINLALFCHYTGQNGTALLLLYRARYLLMLVFGEDHPDLASCDSNIAVILHSLKDYQNALKFLFSALHIHDKYCGAGSLQSALSHHLIARVHSYLADFRTALQHEKTAFTIYQKKLGANHEQTKESSAYLQELTGTAVTMQKTIMELTGKIKPKTASEEAVMNFDASGQKNSHTKTHVVRKKKSKTTTSAAAAAAASS